MKIMKSLERRFRNILNKNPFWSSYICFAVAVTKQKFTKATISHWFNRLVDKNDYSKKEKKGILKHLCNLSNTRDDGIKKR